MPSPNITTSGNILSDDFVELLREPGFKHEALRPETFATPDGHAPKSPDEDLAAAYELLRDQWESVRNDVERFDLSTLRDKWVRPVLRVLDFEPVYLRGSLVLGEGPDAVAFRLSHRGWEGESAPVVHSVEWKQELDQRPGARRSRSPHDQVQRFLNLSAADDWALLTNGRQWRLLRDFHHSLTKGYTEIDLRGILESGDIADFRAFYRLCHASRFVASMPGDKEAQTVCALEKFHRSSHDTGVQVGKKLRGQVKKAIEILGNGFLDGELIALLQNDPEATRRYYREILHLIYRLLFLLFVEQKGWLPMRDPLYVESYSVSGLRDKAVDPSAARDEHLDLWEGLKITFDLVRDGYQLGEVTIPAYGGQLFKDRPLITANGVVRESRESSRIGQGKDPDNSRRFAQFADKCLYDLPLKNRDLLAAMHQLCFFERGKVLYAINYSQLQIDALGSVYESLLDYTPRVLSEPEAIDKTQHSAGAFVLDPRGAARKSSGSYYTDRRLVAELIDSALRPVMEERLKGEGDSSANLANLCESEQAQGPIRKDSRDSRTNALLSIRVCDPACGSGAFLIAAMEAMGDELAQIRCGEEAPTDHDIRRARREVLQHCIYGVDVNPMAVELCKVSLWIAAAMPDLPLNFLDHRIKCGNSLIGAPTAGMVEAARDYYAKQRREAEAELAEVDAELKKLMDNGGTPEDEEWQALEKRRKKAQKAAKVEYVGWPDAIPDDAFKPVADDDRKTASELRKRNKQERSGQRVQGITQLIEDEDDLRLFQQVQTMNEENADLVRQKEELYQRWVRGASQQRVHRMADVWAAAFFYPIRRNVFFAPTQAALAVVSEGKTLNPDLAGEIARLAQEHNFFHWELEFPEVFSAPVTPSSPHPFTPSGFDVVLGNPPWERIKLQEQEFFAVRDPEIAKAPNKAAREKLLKALPTRNPELAQEFAAAKHTAEAESMFVRASERFVLTGVGDVNTYALFAELSRRVLSGTARAGIIVPTGIATDDTTKAFFGDLMEKQVLARFIGFENEAFIFPEVHHAFKFCVLAITGGETRAEQADFAFFCRHFDDVGRRERHFRMSASELALLNPNTSTCPIFRTNADAELGKELHRGVPVLADEQAHVDAWGLRFLRMVDMSRDSGLFRTTRGRASLPLYEAKMIWHFDHRYGSYESRGDARGFRVLPPTPSSAYEDAMYRVKPFYWMDAREVRHRLHGVGSPGWLMGFRDVTAATLERTSVFSVLPAAAVGHKLPLLFLSKAPSAAHAACFLACACSLTFDWLVRQKLGGMSLSYFIIKQCPMPEPDLYSADAIRWIAPRVLELTYTAWDIKAFADDVWRDADDELRGAIKQQWQANKEATGGHEWNPPDWAEIAEDGIPLPPFKWSDDRRAVLRAELDAYYAKLYGLTRKQLRYILDPHGLSDKELEDILDPLGAGTAPEDPTCSGPHLLPERPTTTFPGETFRVLKEKEIRQFGEYRTRRLVLEAWKRQGH